jgi:hypothetical protein
LIDTIAGAENKASREESYADANVFLLAFSCVDKQSLESCEKEVWVFALVLVSSFLIVSG